MTDKPQKLSEVANIASFALLILGGALLFVVAPKQSLSMNEKRRLVPVPEFSWPAILSGRTGNGLNDYFSDHFFWRDGFLAVADGIKSARGWKTGDYEVVETSNHPKPLAAVRQDAKPKADPEIDNNDGDYDNIRSVIIYKNKAVQIAIGSHVTALRFASVVNTYHQTLGPNVKVYCMAIPVGSDFYLPNAINGGQKRELANIHDLYADLAPGVVPVDIYNALAAHTGEYIYFYTDHHWTALGAYYAYRSFAAAAGVVPVAPAALTKKTIPGFLGSLYYYTRSEVLKSNVDHVDYYVIPNKTTETIYPGHGRLPLAGRVYAETAKGGNAYSVFISGDLPVIRIVSQGAGSRKILVIKDSYGNALVPFLAASYGEVWVVDYRSFWGSVAQLVKDHGIDDVLLAHNTYVFNGKFAAARDLKMLQGGDDGAPLAPRLEARPAEAR